MRLVRRALAGAGASLALGALFAGAALGAEPTTAEATADATLTIGLGADDDDLGVDVTVVGIVALTDERSVTDADVRVAATATVGSGRTATSDGTVRAAVAIGGATDAADGAWLDVAAAARIDVDAARAPRGRTSAVAGLAVLIDLDSDRDDAVGASAGLAAGLGAKAADGSDVKAAAVLNLASASTGGASRFSAATGAAAESDAAPLPHVDAASVLAFAAQDTVAAGGETVDGDEPAGGDGAFAPAGTVTATDASLPDTALGTDSEVTLWGILLAVLAGFALARRHLVGRA